MWNISHSYPDSLPTGCDVVLDLEQFVLRRDSFLMSKFG